MPAIFSSHFKKNK